jgi:hypothetical protein
MNCDEVEARWQMEVSPMRTGYPQLNLFLVPLLNFERSWVDDRSLFEFVGRTHHSKGTGSLFSLDCFLKNHFPVAPDASAFLTICSSCAQ